MKFLKYFKESTQEPTLKEKLESIVDMAYYLFDNDAKDSLNNFIGNCSILFTGYLDIRGAFWRAKYPKRFYRFEVDELLNMLETGKDKKGRHVMTEDKLKQIEELYPLSKLKRHTYTKEEIEKMLLPVFDLELFENKIIIKHTIELYYNSWEKKPGYALKLFLDEELFELDFSKIARIKDEVYDTTKKRKLLQTVENHFYRYYNMIKSKLQELNLESKGLKLSLSENTHLNKYDYIYLTLLES